MIEAPASVGKGKGGQGRTAKATAGPGEATAGPGKAAGGSRRKRRKAPTCEECFFRCRGLCALDLSEPCSTFRPDRPEGLVPPRQPALLLRDPEPAEPLARTA